MGAEKKMTTLALAGNPNCGKTSLFNLLTGATQEVGNFPGVTVEYTRGTCRMGEAAFEVVDLPGTYSLTAYSRDEIVTRDYLLGGRADILINVLDASTLDRQLYLTAQLLEMNLPVVLVLNMMDVAERHGIEVDPKEMSEVIGAPVVLMDASAGRGVDELRRVCLEMRDNPRLPKKAAYSHELEDVVTPVLDAVKKIDSPFPDYFLALKLLERDPIADPVAVAHPELEEILRNAEKQLLNHSGEDPQLAISEARLAIASGIVRKCVRETSPERTSISDRIDSVLCHRIFGPLCLGVIVYLLFTMIFGIAEELPFVPLWENGALTWNDPTGALETGFEALSAFAAEHISNDMLRSLVCDGIIGGVGGVLVFVPLIFVMFFFVAFLEDTGYIARVAFILDRVLRVFGLQGKSILSLIVSGGLGGGGCAVPGILSTRTLRGENDRLITIMVTPMMNCGAKFPLYALLIGAFFGRYQSGMMFLLWLCSWIFSMIAAWILRKTVFRGEQTPFIMELPSYHMPKIRGVLQHTWMRTWLYIRKAGTVILAFSVVLWALMYFPHTDGPDQLKHSFAGRAGSVLEPVSRAAGFGWQENVALMGGFAAKEIVVSTLKSAYSMDVTGDEEDDRKFESRLSSSPDWDPVKAFAMILFVMLYVPCMGAVAAIRRETGSWKWTFFQIVFSTTFAFVIAVAVYQLGRLFFG